MTIRCHTNRHQDKGIHDLAARAALQPEAIPIDGGMFALALSGKIGKTGRVSTIRVRDQRDKHVSALRARFRLVSAVSLAPAPSHQGATRERESKQPGEDANAVVESVIRIGRGEAVTS